MFLQQASYTPSFGGLGLRNLGVLSLSPGQTRGIELGSPNGRPRGMFHKGRSASALRPFQVTIGVDPSALTVPFCLRRSLSES